MTWKQFELLLQDYGPIALTCIIALIVLGVVMKSWPLITNFVTVVNALVELPALIETVHDIQKELKPNGGGSIRDVVNHTARQVDGLERRVDEHLGTRPSQVEQRPQSIPPSAPRPPRKPRTRKPTENS